MLYLTAIDYGNSIKTNELNIISESSNSQLIRAEMSAKEEMVSYLSSRYNIDKIFLDVSPWSSTKLYKVGDHAYDAATSKVYIARVEHTNHAVTENTYWLEGDNRNQFIVTCLTDITIYHLFKKINPRNIPEARGVAYDAAREWLRDVAKTISNPKLPLLTDESDVVPQVRYGSNEKKDYRY